MFLWQMLTGIPYTNFGTYDRKSNIDRFEFYNCSLISESVNINITFKIEITGYSQLPVDCNLIVINRELVDIVSGFVKDSVQFIPVKINDKELLGQFFVINPLKSLPLLDRERSTFSLINNTSSIMSIRSYVVKNNSMSNHHLLRNSDFMSDVVVSDELAEGLSRYKIRGFNLTRLKQS